MSCSSGGVCRRLTCIFGWESGISYGLRCQSDIHACTPVRQCAVVGQVPCQCEYAGHAMTYLASCVMPRARYVVVCNRKLLITYTKFNEISEKCQ